VRSRRGWRPVGLPSGMDGRGRAIDNVFIERLWRSVKYEEVYLTDYGTAPEAEQSLASYFCFTATSESANRSAIGRRRTFVTTVAKVGTSDRTKIITNCRAFPGGVCCYSYPNAVQRGLLSLHHIQPRSLSNDWSPLQFYLTRSLTSKFGTLIFGAANVNPLCRFGVLTGRRCITEKYNVTGLLSCFSDINDSGIANVKRNWQQE
jgi:hypothetical protein